MYLLALFHVDVLNKIIPFNHTKLNRNICVCTLLSPFTNSQAVQSAITLLIFANFPMGNFLNLLVGAASPIPFEQHLRCRLLVRSER